VTLRTLRVGVVGTGALGFHHARLMRRMPGVAFAGIYDLNPTRAAEVARARAEIPTITEVETFLRFIEASQRGVLV